jgi:prolipoprotein diacylglyceryltransferase
MEHHEDQRDISGRFWEDGWKLGRWGVNFTNGKVHGKIHRVPQERGCHEKKTSGSW